MVCYGVLSKKYIERGTSVLCKLFMNMYLSEDKCKKFTVEHIIEKISMMTF
jgi:hypothetical protein